MILSDRTIKALVEEGKIKIEGGNSVLNVESASVDLTLGGSFAMIKPKNGIISLDEEVEYTEVKYASKDDAILPPHSFALATTQQKITLPDNVGAFVTGRSSIGRLGLFIENAGWIDPSFSGELTLELYNATSFPIRLSQGRRVAQIIFAQLDNNCEKPYNGKYQNQVGATPSRIYLDGELPKKKVQNIAVEEK